MTLPVFLPSSVKLMPMSPDDIQADGQGMLLGHGLAESPFGECFLAFSGSAIVYLGFPSPVQQELMLPQLQTTWPQATIVGDKSQAAALVAAIFGGAASPATVIVKGTPFQQQVWQALLDIPYGASCSYADIARRIKRPQACRAVGSAVGKNPVSYLLPCHRVLPQGGGVGQYMWGSALKQQMLAYERATAWQPL